MGIVDTSYPQFRVIHLESNEHVVVTNLPKAREMTHARLWGSDHLVCVVGSSLQVYDYRERKRKHVLRGHRGEIVALDAQDDQTITSLGSDGVVKMWEGRTGVCLHSFCVPQATFFFGYPYCVCVREWRIVISADQGVFLLELDGGLSS